MNQVSKAGRIEQEIADKVAALSSKSHTCHNCAVISNAFFKDNFNNGEEVVCWECGKEYHVSPMGITDTPPHWMKPQTPSFLSNPYSFSCPKCVLNGILTTYSLTTDKEFSAFSRNKFFLRCARCDYNYPRWELEMGEQKHSLWYSQNLKSNWVLTQTLELWDHPLPLFMGSYKSRNPGRGMD